MAIETKDLVIYKSERLTDNSDGGGKYSGVVVQDGISNNLFNDVSEMDRTMGDVSMLKIFPAVTTEDTDLLMGATVFVSELPEDPNVSALLFSTNSFTDQRSDAQSRVSSYLARGGRVAGVPSDTHYQGMKTLQCNLFPQEMECSVGDTIVILTDEGLPTKYEQFVRITGVETREAQALIDSKLTAYKVATYQLNDALERDYVGLTAEQWAKGGKSRTVLCESIVADSGYYYSSTKLKENASVGEYTVQAESMFTQLIPSAQTETPILDVSAASESLALVPSSGGTISINQTVSISQTQNMYIGSAVIPSSVSISLAGMSISDQGGLLKDTQGTQVGTIDYQRGLIQWTSSAPTGNRQIALTFRPAATPQQYTQSYALPVTKLTQSMNFSGILVPKPAPGSLSISFMAQGRFYELTDDGSGKLSGSNAAFGSGTINYNTGTWLLTTGALPDVDSVILLHWCTPTSTFSRENLPVFPAKFEFDLEREGIAAGSVTVTWLLEGETKTAVSNSQGKFTGDATGEINYATGKGFVAPKLLPQKGTSFTINYGYGSAQDQTKSALPDANQKITFTIGTGAAIQPNSVELMIPLRTADGSVSGVTARFYDVPVNAGTGQIVSESGEIVGTILYSTGAVEITPRAKYVKYVQTYQPVEYTIMRSA